MEGLDRLVTESLARHGFDRPLDYRRLHWSSWFRCESPHSLLTVPSKPGVFAIAEEVTPLADVGDAHVRTVAPESPPRAQSRGPVESSSAAVSPKRMLAVVQFCEEDDMAFVLDRMFARPCLLRARLESGRCFVRYVVLQDESQRRSICAALNQWLLSSGERATGIGAHFASSLELPSAPDPGPERMKRVGAGDSPVQPAHLDSGASTNLHCPQPLPSGF